MLTNNTVTSGRFPSLKAASGGKLTGGYGALPGGAPLNSVDRREAGPGELGIRVETAIGSHQHKV